MRLEGALRRLPNGLGSGNGVCRCVGGEGVQVRALAALRVRRPSSFYTSPVAVRQELSASGKSFSKKAEGTGRRVCYITKRLRPRSRVEQFYNRQPSPADVVLPCAQCVRRLAACCRQRQKGVVEVNASSLIATNRNAVW